MKNYTKKDNHSSIAPLFGDKMIIITKWRLRPGQMICAESFKVPSHVREEHGVINWVNYRFISGGVDIIDYRNISDFGMY